MAISTHTLTWSVTKDFLRYAIGKIISTHTLTWSVTFLTLFYRATALISTHTLTWSVTKCFTILWISTEFQLTRSRGAWLVILLSFFAISSFQLTRSRGAWLRMIHGNWPTVNFNSHAHVERDNWLKYENVIKEISTHTLTWSVTTMIL